LFAFLPLAKIEVSLGQALASNSPPDCCIELFKSGRPVSPKRKRTPFGVRFLFVSNNHFRYHSLATKKDRHASKISNISFASFDKIY
jgi:hypothetical protein